MSDLQTHHPKNSHLKPESKLEKFQLGFEINRSVAEERRGIKVRTTKH